MLPTVPRLYRRVGRLLCLAPFVGAQIVAPPQVQWQESRPSGFSTECSFCRSDCEVTRQAVAEGNCSTERQSTASAPERNDPRPHPNDDRDCPVCRHVLTAGRILLTQDVELTNALWRLERYYDVAPDQTLCTWMAGCPPVRGPPGSPHSLFEAKATEIGVCNPIGPLTHLSRRHESRICHESEVPRAVCLTMPKSIGTMFSLSINRLSRNCCNEKLLWTNSKSQRPGTC